MSLDGCHLCRPQNPEPETAMVVDIVAHGLVQDFHGVFDVVLHAASKGKDVTEDFLTNIHFDIQRELVSHSKRKIVQNHLLYLGQRDKYYSGLVVKE